MNALDAILTRRSCREFTDKPIKSETLHQLLEAAMSGPSCVNAQDWSFVVVTDPEKLPPVSSFAATLTVRSALQRTTGSLTELGPPRTSALLHRSWGLAQSGWAPGPRWTGWRPSKSSSVCRRPLCPTPSSPLATRKQTLLPRVRAAMRMTGYILTSGKSPRRNHEHSCLILYHIAPLSSKWNRLCKTDFPARFRSFLL